MVRFRASQAVTISVPAQPRSIDEYLSEVDRLVYALVDRQQVEPLSPELFRIKVRPIRFLGVNIQPVCDLKVWLEDGTVRLQSNRCSIEGYESFNQRFSLNMHGYMLSQVTEKGKNLRGQANLNVSVDLPNAFKLTPEPLVAKAGNGLLNGILITLKQRLMRQLIADYQIWSASQNVPIA